MRTKLRRVEEIMKKRGNFKGPCGLPAEAEKALQDEISKLSVENDSIRDKNRKLKAIEKELNIQKVTKKTQGNKYAHVKGKLNNSVKAKQSDKDFLSLIEELRVQLVHGEKNIARLTAKKDALMTNSMGSGRQIGHELEEHQRELMEITKKTNDLKQDKVRDEGQFTRTKQYITEKQSEIMKLTNECQNLEQENFRINLRAQEARDLAEQLKEVRQERDQLEQQITHLTTNPFLKDKNDKENNGYRIGELEIQLQDRRREFNKVDTEEKNKKAHVEELRGKIKKLEGETEYIKGKYEAAKKKFKQEHGEIKPERLQMDIFGMDQTRGKNAINDVTMMMDANPIYGNYDFLEKGEPGKSDKKSLQAEIDRMKHDNKDIAAELDKAQSLLKLQTDIEKENRAYYEEEKERLKLLAQSCHLKAMENSKNI